jgi:hypothetical protein
MKAVFKGSFKSMRSNGSPPQRKINFSFYRFLLRGALCASAVLFPSPFAPCPVPYEDPLFFPTLSPAFRLEAMARSSGDDSASKFVVGERERKGGK